GLYRGPFSGPRVASPGISVRLTAGGGVDCADGDDARLGPPDGCIDASCFFSCAEILGCAVGIKLCPAAGRASVTDGPRAAAAISGQLNGGGPFEGHDLSCAVLSARDLRTDGKQFRKRHAF